jgi:hypothetical protein
MANRLLVIADLLPVITNYGCSSLQTTAARHCELWLLVIASASEAIQVLLSLLKDHNVKLYFFCFFYGDNKT